MDYAHMATQARRMLKANGSAVTLARASTGTATYDTDTGEVTPVAPDTFAGYAVRFEYSQFDMNNAEIRIGDAKLMLVLDDETVTPRSGDTITHAGSAYMVVSSRPMKPATVLLYHEVHVRGVQA